MGFLKAINLVHVFSCLFNLNSYQISWLLCITVDPELLWKFGMQSMFVNRKCAQ